MTLRRAPYPLTLLVLAMSTAQAQTNDAQVQEVLVTAQRTTSVESRTPVAMNVLTSEYLARNGIDHPSDLAGRLPNTYIEGAADGLKITIRGVSNADTTEKGDPSAAFLMDGVYVARSQALNGAFFDIDRVEVLRGPQGTLYGRNTTAGVVNVISNAPTQQREGSIMLGVGDHAGRKIGAMLNIPVGDGIALRAALNGNRHDPYLKNGQGTGNTLGRDRDDSMARLSARFALGASASLLLRYDTSSVRDNYDSIVPDTNFYTGIATGSPSWYESSTDLRLTNGFVPPNMKPEQGFSDKKNTGLAAELNWNLGPATLYYVGSHRNFDHDFLTNYYYRVAPAFALGVRENFSGSFSQNSHELRVASNGSGPWSAQAGLYYFHEDSHILASFRDLQLIGLPPYYVFPNGPVSNRSRAVFGQASYQASTQLRLTAGMRYTDDEKSRYGSTNFQQGPVFDAKTDFKLLNAALQDSNKTTWRLGADYQLDTRTFLYASAATGYKAGGFNDGCAAGSNALGLACPEVIAVPASTLFYQPETVTSYEAGIKTHFWDRRASLNASVFSYDYKNLQLSGVVVLQGAPRYVTTNAGVASVKGLEIDGQFNATTFDRIHYALTWLDAHYVSYKPDGVHSWDGKPLDRAPSATATLGYDHHFVFDASRLIAGLSTRWSTAYSIGVPSQLLEYRIPSHRTSEARLAWLPSGAAWSLSANVRNLENKVRPITIDSFGMTVPSDPRTFDLRFDYRF